MLSFQRRDVYQRAIEFHALAYDLVDRLAEGHGDRADQLVRAAESVVRSIAEAAGWWSEADSSKHDKIARGEAMACAACLDVFKLRKLVAVPRYEDGIRLLEAGRASKAVETSDAVHVRITILLRRCHSMARLPAGVIPRAGLSLGPARRPRLDALNNTAESSTRSRTCGPPDPAS